MSINKIKPTEFHETDQEIKYKLKWLRLDSIDKPVNVVVRGGLTGKVGDTEGEVDYKEARFGLTEFQACTLAEKNTIKAAIALFERELSKKDDELSGEVQDDSDVFG